jgi:hypothetical protein
MNHFRFRVQLRTFVKMMFIFCTFIKVLKCIDQPIRYIAPKTSEALHQKRVLLMANLLPFESYNLRKTKDKESIKVWKQDKIDSR